MLLAAGVARRFYLDGRSKVEIAEEFGMSRFKVARVLDFARESGIVRIDIRLPDGIDAGLSETLRAAYGLRRVIVVDAGDGDQARVRERIGVVAADLLADTLSEGDVLGLTWGRTVNVILTSLTRLPRCTTVQLNGVYSRRDPGPGTVETVQRAAALSGGPAYPIYAPLILPDAATARALRADPGVAAAFDRFGQVTTAVVSIGAWSEGLSTVYDALDPAVRDAIAEQGVRAEMSTHLFDAEGREVCTELADRVLTVSTRELRHIPEVIALAGGDGKAGAIDAALRSGLVSTLVTDSSVARALAGAL
ncbi:sugar-binding transcriptional regulator [Marinactinospora thermotolerans]|uniref:sugar-binding transcriptional regulator n=1 Tax=Marinactinospora thermotolerans TaxID=531310 RepID=UPI00099A4031|nr:sugar-binding domain-containing protein [Marinactinospora thermotolerans]